MIDSLLELPPILSDRGGRYKRALLAISVIALMVSLFPDDVYLANFSLQGIEINETPLGVLGIAVLIYYQTMFLVISYSDMSRWRALTKVKFITRGIAADADDRPSILIPARFIWGPLARFGESSAWGSYDEPVEGVDDAFSINLVSGNTQLVHTLSWAEISHAKRQVQFFLYGDVIFPSLLALAAIVLLLYRIAIH